MKNINTKTLLLIYLFIMTKILYAKNKDESKKIITINLRNTIIIQENLYLSRCPLGIIKCNMLKINSKNMRPYSSITENKSAMKHKKIKCKNEATEDKYPEDVKVSPRMGMAVFHSLIGSGV